MKETIKKIYAKFFFYIFSLIPLKNKVVFSSFSGKRYGDNPKIVSNKLYNDFNNIKQVWLFYNNKFNDMPNGIKQVKWGSIGMIYHLATAKVWVDSHTKPLWVKKRKNQYYINTWHGGLGLKKIEGDAKDTLKEKDIKRIKNNSKMVDVFISNSKWLTDIYKRAFWYNGVIEKIGYPKDEFLENFDVNIARKKVYKYCNQDINTNFLLYVPTMREKIDINLIKFDSDKIISHLSKKFGGKWKILLRLHPMNEKEVLNFKKDNNIINVTKYEDILELILSTEILISDYSSCIFDATLIRKKAIIYAPDYEEYQKERGLYFTLEELPFLTAKNEDELCNCIDKFNNDKYIEKINEYYTKVEYINDGRANDKIVKMITDFIYYNKKIERGK